MSEELVSKCILGHDAQGRICFAQKSPFGLEAAPEGLTAIEVSPEEFALVSAHVGSESLYVEDGIIQAAPARPTPHHAWDWSAKAWLPQIGGAVAARKLAVERECARRILLPIAYDGALFDADSVARERITGTLARLLRGGGLPVGWIGWRDYANAMHWSADPPATVQAALAGLSAAIEDREQALLVAAWQHKAAIDDLDDVAAVLAYPVGEGWPA